MKKLLALLIAVIMCFGLSSCSKTESPEKAAENVLIAFQKGDFETIEKYMTGTFSSEGEESSSEDEEMIKNITKNLTFEIKSSEEKDGKATVNVDITNVDMSVVMQNVFSTMFTELLSSAFNEDGTEKTQEEINTRTIEIMNEANKVSEAIGLGKANPVIRSSGPIIKTNIEKDKEALYIVNRVKEYQSQGFKSIAIVYKDQTNMMELNRLLKKEKIESEIIYKDQEKYNGGVCILTSYLSKGLEFDVVIIADADDSIYLSNNILDMKLLYVAMTRALHKLELIYNNNICKYLK